MKADDMSRKVRLGWAVSRLVVWVGLWVELINVAKEGAIL